MKVTVFDYTGAGSPDPARHAASVLLFTKSTRLNMTPDLIDQIKTMSDEEVMFNLRMMANTNPGSWEFVEFKFLFEGVSRALQQQLTRTRHAAYAIQTLRVVDVKKWEYETGPSIKGNTDLGVVYDSTMRYIDHAYRELIKNGAEVEDARGILPLNIKTNMCMKIDMRNFITLSRKRMSGRVQNEYRLLMEAAVIEVEKIYPWFHIFYKNDEMKAYKDLIDMIMDNENITSDEKTNMYKKIDIIKSGLD
jgi:flavin-dependent thymidylate synthase